MNGGLGAMLCQKNKKEKKEWFTLQGGNFESMKRITH
jgi:hypothetical protein